MGVKQLSNKIRKANHTPDSIACSRSLHKLKIGVYLSVVLHKALGSQDGAGEFFVHSMIPNSEVEDKCTRLCGFAKRNGIQLIVSVDGKYHPMKDNENAKRQVARDKAKQELETHIQKTNLDNAVETKKAFSLMKKAAFVSDYVIGTAINKDIGYKNHY